MVSFLWPQTWLLYVASAVLGAGAALIWTGQGTYLSKCSNPSNISRNSGVFWALLQLNMFFGNLFVYYQFQGKTHIDNNTRQLVFSVLIAVAVIGVIFLGTLRQPYTTVEISEKDGKKSIETMENDNSVIGAFRNAIRLFFTGEMMLLSITFLYTGILSC